MEGPSGVRVPEQPVGHLGAVERADRFGVVRDVERFLQLAWQIRDHIIQSNIRLVVSIVKSFLKPTLDFDDLLSDGFDALIRATQNFDYDRGFRFSTYATMVIRRHLGRQLQLEAVRKKRFDASYSSKLVSIANRASNPDLEAMTSKKIAIVLLTMLNSLDDRERYIVNERFGFGTGQKKRTLTSLAKELGVCKERVRQLEQRALKKLRQMSSKNVIGQMESEISA